MRRYLSLLLFAGITLAQNINVDGYAFLDDSEIHDSIKINFDMEAPTSHSDSTFTNIDGYYEVSIPQGIYSITYSYPDMISTTYSGVVLYNDSTLTEFNFPYSLDTLYVPNEFQTIQDAVDAAVDGSTIILDDGNYSEYVEINKSITIGSKFLANSDSSHIYATQLSLANEENIVFNIFDSEGLVRLNGLRFIEPFGNTYLTKVINGENTTTEIRNCIFDNIDGTALTFYQSTLYINSCSFNYITYRANRFENCTVEIKNSLYANSPMDISYKLYVLYSSVEIDSSSFQNNIPTSNTFTLEYGQGIMQFYNSDLQMQNTTIKDNISLGSLIFLTNEVGSTRQHVIKGCTFDNNLASLESGITVVHSNSLLVENNVFQNNLSGRAGSINVHLGHSVIISNNLIVYNSIQDFHGNTYNESSAGLFVNFQSGHIKNNTIAFNSTSIEESSSSLSIGEHSPIIENNIIISNSPVGYLVKSENPNPVFQYNNVYDSSGIAFDGLNEYYLEFVNTNPNGDEVDPWYNLSMDPKFINPDSLNFRIQSGSPCVNAGSPETLYDPDATISDIGAFFYPNTIPFTWDSLSSGLDVEDGSVRIGPNTDYDFINGYEGTMLVFSNTSNYGDSFIEHINNYFIMGDTIYCSNQDKSKVLSVIYINNISIGMDRVSATISELSFQGSNGFNHMEQVYISKDLNWNILSNDKISTIPKSFILHQNYPNPFNPFTTLQYELIEDEFVQITIYDLLGNTVNKLVNTNQSLGPKSIQWNATNNKGQSVSAGVYMYTIEAGDFRQTKKMILLK